MDLALLPLLQILNIIARILDPTKEMKSKFYDGLVNGSKSGWDAKRNVESAQILDEMAVSRNATSRITCISCILCLKSIVCLYGINIHFKYFFYFLCILIVFWISLQLKHGGSIPAKGKKVNFDRFYTNRLLNVTFEAC